MTDKNPKSQMLRVPTVLIPYVKELSSLHRKGQTDSIINGLQHLIADIQSCADSSNDSGSDIDSNIDSSSDSKTDSSSNFDSNVDITLDQKLIADILKRLEQLESVVLQDPIMKAVSRTQPVPSKKQHRFRQLGSVTIPASAYTKGLTQYEVCELYDLTYSNLSRTAKLEGLTSPEYLYNYVGWRYRRGRYYPPVH